LFEGIFSEFARRLALGESEGMIEDNEGAEPETEASIVAAEGASTADAGDNLSTIQPWMIILTYAKWC
jgi:hypothetical protein